MASEQELRQMYRDANTDGKDGLTIAELKDFIKSVNPKLADQFAERAFKKMNKDGDDVISEDEFVQYVLKRK